MSYKNSLFGKFMCGLIEYFSNPSHDALSRINWVADRKVEKVISVATSDRLKIKLAVKKVHK